MWCEVKWFPLSIIISTLNGESKTIESIFKMICDGTLAIDTQSLLSNKKTLSRQSIQIPFVWFFFFSGCVHERKRDRMKEWRAVRGDREREGGRMNEKGMSEETIWKKQLMNSFIPNNILIMLNWRQELFKKKHIWSIYEWFSFTIRLMRLFCFALFRCELRILIVIYSTDSVPSVHSAEEAQKGTANGQTANHLHCRDFFLVLLFFLTFSFTGVVLLALYKPVCVRSQGEVDKLSIFILVSHIFPFLLHFFIPWPKQSIYILPLLLLLAFCLGIHNENNSKIKASIKFGPKAGKKRTIAEKKCKSRKTTSIVGSVL